MESALVLSKNLANAKSTIADLVMALILELFANVSNLSLCSLDIVIVIFLLLLKLSPVLVC